MNYLELDDELQHFGIKGMKWGHRNKYDKSIPKIGQFSSKIKTNTSKRKNMKRSNEKKIASLKKSDPKRRELINMNKDMTSMNSTAERRLARNRAVKKGIVKTTKFAGAAALNYQLLKIYNPKLAEGIRQVGLRTTVAVMDKIANAHAMYKYNRRR